MNSRRAAVLVLGTGVSGFAARELLVNEDVEVVVLGKGDVIPYGDYDFAVISPGIPQDDPLARECIARGIPLKSELQLGVEALKRKGWRLLAVTGSKGKSSAVKVIADSINLAGGNAVACGNYGLPVSKVALSKTPGWAVVEVSSFMMETTSLPEDFFEAAAILNLQEDHLDRHGSVEVYHALKKRLLTMAKVDAGAKLDARDGDEVSGSYFDNAILRQNGIIASRMMAIAGLDEAARRRGFKEFVPLAHRMNEVAVIDGVKYIDDSKATSLAALAAGVEMAGRNVRLIAGGLPKGDDPKNVLSALTNRVKKVYIIGQSAEAFFQAWSSEVNCEICGTMDNAVEAVKREAECGDTVLLSPGTASYDQFKNFEERGDVFARLVKEGTKNE